MAERFLKCYCTASDPATNNNNDPWGILGLMWQYKEILKATVHRKEAYPIQDTNLPQQLIMQFQPLFCQLCNCQHTSKVTAKMHYKSKRHKRRVMKYLTEHSQYEMLTNGHSEYKPQVQKLQCTICNVPITSEQQMQLHMNGSKHQKKMKQLNLELDQEDPGGLILPSLEVNVAVPGLSTFRTPTGFYYCNVCNFNIKSEFQFKQHLESKRHHKRLSNYTYL
ncbi:hypothetical protein FQA39_LY15945 [Lamprigera yunnana]|nr:hypothetical protein FQA39_LY15945 [Lamprigera yunnana]